MTDVLTSSIEIKADTLAELSMFSPTRVGMKLNATKYASLFLMSARTRIEIGEAGVAEVFIGSVVSCEVEFDNLGEAVSPATVRFGVLDTINGETWYPFDDVDVVQVSENVFRLRFSVVEEGRYRIRAQAVAPQSRIYSAVEGQFDAVSSNN